MFTIQPDLFSLKAFEARLKKENKIYPSSVFINAVKQLKKFTLDLRETYLDLILKHIDTPSRAFQKEMGALLVPSSYNPCLKVDNYKYLRLNRSGIRGFAVINSIMIFPEIFDRSDSDYPVFITSIKRKPLQELAHYRALFGSWFIIRAIGEPTYSLMEKELWDYLRIPEHRDFFIETKKDLTWIYSNIKQALDL